jgi:predicted lipoprotein with Yx(FWY)xxD motif
VKISLTLGLAVTALALLAGCGSSKTTSSSSGASTTSATPASAGSSRYSHANSTATTTTAAGAAGGPMLITTKHDKLGTVLAAGPMKLTVYLFEADKGAVSACSGACAAAWPPVTTSGSPQSSASAVAADLGTITRSDGSKQVTYKGHPLYYFIKDKDAGDAYGQGSKAFGASWYVLAPSGKKIDPS